MRQSLTHLLWKENIIKHISECRIETQQSFYSLEHGELEPFHDFVTSSLRSFLRIKQAVAVEMERPLGGVHFKLDRLGFNYNLLRGVCVAKASKRKPSELLKSVTAPIR